MRKGGNKNKQKGVALVGVTVAMLLMGYLMQSWFLRQVDDYKANMYSLQAKRVADIGNALVRYISMTGDPANGILAPHQQWNVAGAAFEDGAIHTGLDWLKSTDCTNGEADIELLPCDYRERPVVGDNQMYRFVVSNDGTNVVPTFQLVDAGNVSRGLVIDGVLQPEIAALISTQAEGLVTFSTMGSVNSFFSVERATAILSAEVGINVANTPFQRTDGATPITGDEHFANGAGIVFDTPADIQGASNISAERFSAFDAATNTVSNDRYLEPAGTSEIESLNAAGEINASTIVSDEGYIDALQTQYIEQLDPNVQNLIRGELRIGDNTDHTTFSQGHMFTTGNIYDANDPNFLINPDGTSRMQDIAIGALNEALLSERLPNFVQKGALVVVANTLVPRPTCGASGASRMIMVPLRWTTFFLDAGAITINNNVNEFYADETPTSWVSRIKTYDPATLDYIDDPQGTALANIFCYYP